MASDGGLFAFGDAGFFGSMGGKPLNKPIVGIAAATDGAGYAEVASDGGIFNFGSVGFFGSAGSLHLNAPVVGIATAPDMQGYWTFASDGGVFNYGTGAPFKGSAGSLHLNKPVVGGAADLSRHRPQHAGAPSARVLRGRCRNQPVSPPPRVRRP